MRRDRWTGERIFRVSTRAAGASLFLFVSLARAASLTEADAPRRLGLEDSVAIGLTQIEVTAWPDDPESDACVGLAADDLELFVEGKPRPIYAVDAIGSETEPPRSVAPARVAPAPDGMSIVLLFDLWHLDLFYRGFSACPRTKPLAFEEARRLVREEFRPGDRLLLVTFSGWPIVHYGWIETRSDALAALDRLEKNRQVISNRTEHEHHNGWIRGLESLFLALGRYPGRKEVLYLADDFRFDDVSSRMVEIAGRAQANGVVVSAVDLLASCRTVWGPGPHESCSPDGGGLGCTPFRTPVALNPISRDTGGSLFRRDRIDLAIRDLRAARRCRYLVSFRTAERELRKTPSVSVRLRNARSGLTLHAPSGFETPEGAPSGRDRDEAVFLLPRFGQGIGAEIALWPYRPDGRRWKALALARIERTDDVPWPEEVGEIHVDVVVHRQSRIYGTFRKTIAGRELEAFRTPGAERLFVFSVEKVRPGEITASVTVTSDSKDLSANNRTSHEVPRPPEAGETAGWHLADRWVRIGEALVRAPSFDGIVSPGESASVLAYACRAGREGDLLAPGRLRPVSGGSPFPLPLAWLVPPRGAADACGWIVGALPGSLAPGLWTFEPPPGLGGGHGGLDFSVASFDPAETPPAEIAFD